MNPWLWIAIGLAAMVASWGVLIVLASRLPQGSLKELVGFLPACATTVNRLRNDPRVPRRAKIAVALAAIWVASPIDPIPDFIPVIGVFDDVLVVALVLRYAARRVPRQIVLEAWPANPTTIERLLGN